MCLLPMSHGCFAAQSGAAFSVQRTCWARVANPLTRRTASASKLVFRILPPKLYGILSVLGSDPIQIMCLRDLAQPLRRALWRDVPLRIPQHFVADHKLLHCGRPQKGRKIMRVEMPLRISLTIRGPLVEPHRIWKRALKQIVVANRNPPQNIAT